MQSHAASLLPSCLKQDAETSMPKSRNEWPSPSWSRCCTLANGVSGFTRAVAFVADVCLAHRQNRRHSLSNRSGLKDLKVCTVATSRTWNASNACVTRTSSARQAFAFYIIAAKTCVTPLVDRTEEKERIARLAAMAA